MLRFCFPVLLLLSNACPSQARGTQADSLLRSILSLPDRSARMQSLYLICTQRYNDAPQQAQRFAEAFYKENEAQPSDSNTAKAHYLMGDVHLLLGNYDESLKHCLKALKLAEQEQMYALQMEVLSDISGIYLRTDDAEKSLKTIQQALSIARARRDRVYEAKLMNGLGIRYAAAGKPEAAIRVFDSSLAMSRLLHLPQLEENVLENKAITYGMMRQYEQALATFKTALALADSISTQNIRAGIWFQLSDLYLNMNRLPESAAAGETALRLSEEVEDPAFIIALYELLSKIKAQQGDYQTALSYLRRQTLLKDSVFTDTKTRQIEELKTRYDTEIKDKQLTAQSAQLSLNRRINLYLWLGSGLLLVIGLLIYLNQRKTKRLYRQIYRQSEELQNKSNELEHLNQLKDRLFSTISHDMRAPVNALLSFSMLLDRGAISEEKLSLYTKEIKSTLIHTSGLMENLLNFARSQMKGFHPRLEAVDLAVLTTDALSLAATQAVQKGTLLQNKVLRGALVLADINMLGVIIRNLVGNAIKFTGAGGKIVLSTGREGDFCYWQVQDNGVGIDEEQVRAFNNSQSLEQPLDQTTGTQHEKGTGLGLLLSKAFLSVMNGHMVLDSSPGQGSIFRIYLPAAHRDSDGSFAGQSAPSAPAGKDFPVE